MLKIWYEIKSRQLWSHAKRKIVKGLKLTITKTALK